MQKNQALAAGILYGIIALPLLGLALIAAYALTREQPAPAMVFICALFGMAGCGATLVAIFCFRRAF